MNARNSKYYEIGPDYHALSGGNEYELLNEPALQPGGPKGRELFAADSWPDGVNVLPRGPWRFPDYATAPRLLIRQKKGRAIRDFAEIRAHDRWAVSAKMKALLDSIAPGTCDYRRCEVVLPSGEPGPETWLCTVTTAFMGAANIEACGGLINYGTFYGKGACDKLVLRPEVIGDAHIFRVVEVSMGIVCDQFFADACKAAGIKGISFEPLAKPERNRLPQAKAGPPQSAKASVDENDAALPLAPGISDPAYIFAQGDRAPALSLAIAARAALRAIPLLERRPWNQPRRKKLRDGRPGKSDSDVVLGTFRANATAWVAALFPEFGNSDFFQKIQHDARMAGCAHRDNSVSAFASKAAHDAVDTASWVYWRRTAHWNPSAETAPNRTYQTKAAVELGFQYAYLKEEIERMNALRGGQSIPSQARFEIERIHSEAVAEDLRFWEKAAKDTKLLLLQPLWLRPAPEYLLAEWRYLRARLLERKDENWDVWTSWYEHRLKGCVSVQESAEIARVSLAEEKWNEGAALANVRIRQLLPAQTTAIGG